VEHVFNDLIDSFSLSVSLRMIGRALDEMGAQTFMQLLPKASNKDGSSIGDNGFWNTMIADNVQHVELGILSDPVCGGYGYKVS
jgi:hypothetical protein